MSPVASTMPHDFVGPLHGPWRTPTWSYGHVRDLRDAAKVQRLTTVRPFVRKVDIAEQDRAASARVIDQWDSVIARRLLERTETGQ